MATTSTPVHTNLPSIHPISTKLDRTNYIFWKTQVFATARAYGFEDVLVQNTTPRQYIDEVTQNPEYLIWLRRDQFIFSWILAAIAPSMIGYVGCCTTSAQLWNTFEKLFQSQSKARSAQLRFQLQSIKKGDLSIDDYIMKFRSISDQLFSIGQQISDSDIAHYVLGGLGQEFESICVVLQSKNEELSLDELQYALQTHEIRLQNQNSSLSTVFTQQPCCIQ